MTDTIKIGTKSRRIFCISNGEYYDSSREAAEKLQINATNISKQLNGARSHVSGYVFIKAPELLSPERVEQLRQQLRKEAENQNMD